MASEGVGKRTGQKQSIVLITRDGIPNVDLSAVFVDEGDHANTIPWQHVYLHRARRYLVNNYNAALGDGDTIDIAIISGAVWAAHIIWEAAAVGDMLIQVFRGASITGGTAMDIINRNQEGTVRPSTFQAKLNPTVESGGDGIDLTTGGILLPGGSAGRAVGGAGEGREEFIQCVNETWLYRITNISGQARKTNLRLDFYEHEPIITS